MSRSRYFFVLFFIYFERKRVKKNVADILATNRCTGAGASPATDTQVKFLLTGGASC